MSERPITTEEDSSDDEDYQPPPDEGESSEDPGSRTVLTRNAVRSGMVPSISNQRVATDSSRNSAQEKSRIETLWASFQGEKKLKKQSDPIGLSDLIVPTVPDSSSATQISTSEEQNNVSMALTSSEETAATTSGNETESPTVSSAGKMEQSQVPPRKRVGGGLAGLLDQINKKPKLSTLERSKSEWESFKKVEGIQEELKTFNRGRDGFLERQEFLQRTDYRQFEKERSVRNSARKPP